MNKRKSKARWMKKSGELKSKNLTKWLFVRTLLNAMTNKRRLRIKNVIVDEEMMELIGIEEFYLIELHRGRTAVIEKLKELEKRYRQGDPWLPETIRKNCKILVNAYGLNDAEEAILHFLCLMNVDSTWKTFMSTLKAWDLFLCDYISFAMEIPVKKVMNGLKSNSVLVKSGVIEIKRGIDEWNFKDNKTTQALLDPECKLKHLIKNSLVELDRGSLRLGDFPDIDKDLKIITSFIRAALKEQRKGVNLIFHGGPGVGKTQLALALARHLRTSVYEVGIASGDEPMSPRERFQALSSAQALTAKSRCILVFDEVEDIFGKSCLGSSLSQRHKAWLNRTLEKNPRPTIWISNTLEGIDPAIMRRFDYALKVPNLRKDQLKKAYRKLSGGKLSNQLLDSLCATAKLTPALVEKAYGVAATISKKGDKRVMEDAFCHILNQNLNAQGYNVMIQPGYDTKARDPYDIGYLNTDIDLDQLADNLKGNESCRICLYGPPGTGKTSFGKWVARELGRPLVLKNPSDLLDAYVGSSERLLAGAFAECKQSNAILMIDEVDSFLQKRAKALRTWEVTQVNELLTQMEQFEGTFIATTNNLDSMDDACLRRFDLKVRCGFLTLDKAMALTAVYARQLGLRRQDDKQIKSMLEGCNCTPGDFANVARQHRFRRFCDTAGFLQAIQNECSLKTNGRPRSIGFAGSAA